MVTRFPLFLRSLLLASCFVVAAQAQSEIAAAKTYTGTVLDERGEPLAGVAVCEVPNESHWLPETLLAACKVRTDERGRFDLTVTGVGVTKALFVARGRVRLVQSLKLLAIWPVQLAKAGALAGQGRGQDGEPIAGARIVAEDYLRGLPFVQDKADGNTQAWLYSIAVADARGRFVLRGVYDTAVRLTVSALGYHDLEVGPVSKLEPLSLALQKVPGVVTGVVWNPAGEPAAGVAVRAQLRQAPRTSTTTTTDDKGCFACNWYGGATRISAYASISGVRNYVFQDVSEPQACELRLAPIKDPAAGARSRPQADLVKPDKQLRVTAKGPDGKVRESFRVAVFQIHPGQQKYRTDVRQLGSFDGCAVEAVGGVATAPVYDSYGKGGWLVLASATGCATVRRQVDVDTEGVDLEFVAAAPVRGVVTDARSGKPVAGVRVWFLMDLEDHAGEFEELQSDAFCVKTAVDGGFVLRDAPIAKGRLFFSVDGYEPTWRPCEVGGKGEPIEVALEPLVPLPGKIKPESLARQLIGLRALRNLPGGDSREFAALDGVAPVAATGAFRLLEQSVGERHFQVLVQRLPRQGRPDKVIVGKQLLDHDTKQLELDAGLAIPLRVRGKVTGPVPVQRLAVLCAPTSAGGMHYGYLQYCGPLCSLAIDGSYDLQAVRGKRVLAVIDVVSGVMYARADVDLSDGRDQQRDFRIDAHEVTVRIEASDGERAVGDFFFEVLPSREFWPQGIGQISGSDGRLSYCRGMGVRVPATSSEASLWLPPCAWQVGLRRYSRYSGAQANGAARAAQGIDPQKDRVVKLTW